MAERNPPHSKTLDVKDVNIAVKKILDGIIRCSNDSPTVDVEGGIDERTVTGKGLEMSENFK